MLGEQFSQPVHGPAYTRAFKGAATVVVLLVVVQAMRAWDVLGPALSGQAGWIFIGGFFVLLGSYALLLRSQTRVDAEGIRQTGIIDKAVRWDEIKVARLRGFPFARRLVVSTGYGKLRAFYAGTQELEAAFARISAAFPRPARR
jgi:hypothetical protein